MSEDKAVYYEHAGGVGVLTLNRPDNRNSMTVELLDAFVDAVAEARSDTDARCVVITGKGRCFSAGADLTANLQKDGARPLQPHERSYAMYEPFLSVLDIEVPVIGALNGHTVGGGLGLALVCDIRIGNREAKYGANFARLGLHPGMAISYILPRVVGVSRAAEMLFGGELIDGAEAERIGLLSHAVDAQDVVPRATTLANRIAQNAPIAVRMTKKTFYEGLHWNVRAAAMKEAFAQAVTLETNDVKEGIDALLQKRDPNFTGT